MSNLLEDEIEFKKWLTGAQGLKGKVANDIVSRCKRIELITGKSLISHFTSDYSFSDLMCEVKNAILLMPIETKARYAVTASLRLAAKKYALFKNANLEYFD